MNFDKIINERKSVRKFSRKKPDWREIIEAIDVARKGPLAGNIPTLFFMLIDDSEKIAKLAKAANQDFIADTSFVVVICSDKADAVRSYGERGEIYVRQQAGAAIENFLLKITESGLGTCWVGSFVDEQVKTILKIPEHIYVEAMFPIGYPFLEGKQKRKPPFDRCLFFNQWRGRFMGGRKTIEAH
jgi:nitroreductase